MENKYQIIHYLKKDDESFYVKSVFEFKVY